MLKSHLVILLTLFVSLPAVAASPNYKEMRKGDLIKVNDSLEEAFAIISNRLTQKTGTRITQEEYDKEMIALVTLRNVPVYETAMAIWLRLSYELASVPPPFQSQALITVAFDALEEIASATDVDLLHAISKTHAHIKASNYQGLVKFSEIRDRNVELLKNLNLAITVKKDREPLAIMNDLIGVNFENQARVLQNLKELSEMLKKRIKGQPEVINALEMLEWKREFFARSPEQIEKNEPIKPGIIYGMGMQSTGRRTTAEAFTDALHGKEGSFNEHMFSIRPLAEQSGLWELLGSSTGFTGSDNFPPFLRFLVEHSGGKYLIDKTEAGKTFVKKNEDWIGKDLPGYPPAHTAVVYIESLHLWPKSVKDQFLIPALKRGEFKISNPNGGEEKIQVPVYFFISSAEGSDLLVARDAQGARVGKPLTFEELSKKWEVAANDPEALKASIRNYSRPRGGAVAGREGISEELLGVIPNSSFILYRPLGPETLQDVAQMQLETLAQSLATESPLNPGIEFSWNDELIRFVQDYEFNAEDGAGAVTNRVESLLKEPLIKFVQDKRVDMEKPFKLHLSLVKNEDQTHSVNIMATTKEGNFIGNFEELIPATLKDKTVDAIDDAEIERILALGDQIKSRVFGVDGIVDRVVDRLLTLANAKAKDSKKPRNASTIVLLGLSSTGKTELAKSIAEAVKGSDQDALTIDFSSGQSLKFFQDKLLGSVDHNGNPIKSEFMKHYDRSNGDIVVIMDEISNVKDMDLLKSLYDFFREPVVTTFSDGKPRDMTRVKLIVTGNSGIEVYKDVPRNIPIDQQMMAWKEISRKISKNPEYQRQILERSFSEALINRWTLNNIFFVEPHNHKSLKQLAQLKFKSGMSGLEPGNGKRGWYLGFESEQTYTDLMEQIVERGFVIREQGASIESYVKDNVIGPLEAELMKAKVAQGSKVIIRKQGQEFVITSEDGRYNKALTLATRKNKDDEKAKTSKEEQIKTAYHEVGHALATRILMDGQMDVGYISILPGVTQINDRWVHYAGIAVPEQTVAPELTREWVIRRIAIFAAGETAQRLITNGEIHDAGKSNDMERSTDLAQKAVLRWGLSDAWGTESIPTGVETEDYIARLSNSKKELFEKEVKKLIDEGRALAREILENNFERVLVPLSKRLAEQGRVEQDEMETYFDKAVMVYESQNDRGNRTGFNLATRVRNFLGSFTKRGERRDGVLKDGNLYPADVADIGQIIAAMKQKLYDEVEALGVPVFDGAEFPAATEIPNQSCESLLVRAL